MHGAFGMSVGKLQSDRTRPAAAGQSLADRRKLRDIIEDFVSAADGESGRAVELAMANRQQTLDAAFGEAAGSRDIDRFGGQCHDLAFDERLDDTMDRVARVAGGSEIENLRRHAVFSRSNGQRRSEPSLGGPCEDKISRRTIGEQLSIFVQGALVVKCGG